MTTEQQPFQKQPSDIWKMQEKLTTSYVKSLDSLCRQWQNEFPEKMPFKDREDYIAKWFGATLALWYHNWCIEKGYLNGVEM